MEELTLVSGNRMIARKLCLFLSHFPRMLTCSPMLFNLFKTFPFSFRHQPIKKTHATAAIAPYNQKVAECPRNPIRVRKVTATTKLKPQLATVATLMAAPRTFKGNISEIISQKTGPSPKAKQATYIANPPIAI